MKTRNIILTSAAIVIVVGEVARCVYKNIGPLPKTKVAWQIPSELELTVRDTTYKLTGLNIPNLCLAEKGGKPVFGKRKCDIG